MYTMAEPAQEKIDKINEALGDKFSKDEIREFINMARTLTAKAVFSALVAVVKATPESQARDSIIKQLEKLMPSTIGYVQCEFDDFEFKLNITLCLVPRTYITRIGIPSEQYKNDLYAKYNMLKKLAIAYWRQVVKDYPTLVDSIAALRPDVNFENLVIDVENPSTMYFDSMCSHRIGIFCYYVDQNGKAYYHKDVDNGADACDTVDSNAASGSRFTEKMSEDSASQAVYEAADVDVE